MNIPTAEDVLKLRKKQMEKDIEGLITKAVNALADGDRGHFEVGVDSNNEIYDTDDAAFVYVPRGFLFEVTTALKNNDFIVVDTWDAQGRVDGIRVSLPLI